MRGGQGSSDFTGNGRRGRAGLGATALLVALGLAVTASPAAGSVTLGQLATPPLTASNDCSGAQTEFVQTSAAVGNTY
ncbi:MAG: hypothetical protein M3M99_03070, partial [Actinomycetota bacterium]|nr:hypothetical protein [Actinomycetota bacterium]